MISLTFIADRLKLKAFRENRSGAAAVEFAFIAPILIMIYLGLAELTLGMMASRRAAHLAATVGDLASQSESLTTANITDIFEIGESMLHPFAADESLKIRLTSVTMNSSSQAKVDWSDTQNMTAFAKGDTIAEITEAQLPKGESLIMTEVEYSYKSPVADLLPGITKFEDTFFHHPRSGTAVTRK